MDLLAWFRRRPATDGSGSAPAPLRRQEWSDVPPLQRVVDGPSLITAPDRFRGELTTWSDPSLIGTPGHLVSDAAPTGTGVGIATPVPPAPQRAEPVQRQVIEPAAQARRLAVAASPPPAALISAEQAPVPPPVPFNVIDVRPEPIAADPVAAEPTDVHELAGPSEAAATPPTMHTTEMAAARETPKQVAQRTVDAGQSIGEGSPVTRRFGLGAPLQRSTDVGSVSPEWPTAASAAVPLGGGPISEAPIVQRDLALPGPEERAASVPSVQRDVIGPVDVPLRPLGRPEADADAVLGAEVPPPPIRPAPPDVPAAAADPEPVAPLVGGTEPALAPLLPTAPATAPDPPSMFLQRTVRDVEIGPGPAPQPPAQPLSTLPSEGTGALRHDSKAPLVGGLEAQPHSVTPTVSDPPTRIVQRSVGEVGTAPDPRPHEPTEPTFVSRSEGTGGPLPEVSAPLIPGTEPVSRLLQRGSREVRSTTADPLPALLPGGTGGPAPEASASLVGGTGPVPDPPEQLLQRSTREVPSTTADLLPTLLSVGTVDQPPVRSAPLVGGLEPATARAPAHPAVPLLPVSPPSLPAVELPARRLQRSALDVDFVPQAPAEPISVLLSDGASAPLVGGVEPAPAVDGAVPTPTTLLSRMAPEAAHDLFAPPRNGPRTSDEERRPNGRAVQRAVATRATPPQLSGLPVPSAGAATPAPMAFVQQTVGPATQSSFFPHDLGHRVDAPLASGGAHSRAGTDAPALPPPTSHPFIARQAIDAEAGGPQAIELPAAPPPTAIQRAPDDEPPDEPGPAIQPAPAPAPAPAAAAPPAGQSAGNDVDALVNKLYEPIIGRLKAELRLERERAGHALDLRL